MIISPEGEGLPSTERLSGDERLARAGIRRVSTQEAIGMSDDEFAETVEAAGSGDIWQVLNWQLL